MAAPRTAKRRPRSAAVRQREHEAQQKTLGRLRLIEDHLAAGTSPDEIDEILVAEEGISHRQARRLRASLRERWREQVDEEGASRREQVWLQTQRFYQLCIAGEKPNLPAAASAAMTPSSSVVLPTPEGPPKPMTFMGVTVCRLRRSGAR